MKPPEPTGERIQPPVLPIRRRAIIEQALTFLSRLENDRWATPENSFPGILAELGILVRGGTMYETLSPYKKEWEEELAKRAPEYPSFKDSQTLEELLQRIDEQGGVVGSQGARTREQIQEDILSLLGLRRLAHQLKHEQEIYLTKAKKILRSITSTQDLRETVDRLTAKEAPAPMAIEARDYLYRREPEPDGRTS